MANEDRSGRSASGVSPGPVNWARDNRQGAYTRLAQRLPAPLGRLILIAAAAALVALVIWAFA
jgi:hypothetical protein